MNDLKKINIIAYYTFREIVKSKILLNVLFLGIALLTVTFVAFNFTYGDPARVALDFGLGTLTLSSVGIAIFIGVGLLSKEIDSRTVYMIISRPVKRFQFILGKIIGLGLVLILNISLLSLLTLTCYFAIGGEFYPIILWSILFIMLESILVLLVVSFLSLVTSPTLSVLFTIILYISGHSISSAKLTTFASNSKIFSSVLELYQFVLPAFYKLNIKEFVIYKQSLPIEFIIKTAAYGFIYSIFLIFLSIIIFEKKNLD
jgi:ABC-type transport system involved in multi-copper enzyme maturation permease subunit